MNHAECRQQYHEAIELTCSHVTREKARTQCQDACEAYSVPDCHGYPVSGEEKRYQEREWEDIYNYIPEVRMLKQCRSYGRGEKMIVIGGQVFSNMDANGTSNMVQ